MNAMEIHGITKRYKGFALEDIHLELERGFVLGLIGPNGAGKTTLLKSIINLVVPDEGSLTLLGQESRSNLREIKQRVAFVHEQDYLYEDMTARKHGELLAPFYRHWDMKRFFSLLDRLAVDPDKKCQALSKGMKTKLRLALALSHDAELILLDEPASGLDPLVRREIRELLAEEIASEGRSIVLSSHITEDLDSIADFIAMIDDGRIIAQGTKDGLLERWNIVKGDAALLDNGASAYLQGVRRTEVGFTAISSRREELESEYPGQLLFERPVLGDLMVHILGGNK